VAIFFVLSGFVLTFRAMQTRDWSQIVVGAVRRWPRLVLLVVAVNILSAILQSRLYQDRSWFGAKVFGPPTSVIRSALVEAFSRHFFNASARLQFGVVDDAFRAVWQLRRLCDSLVMMFQKTLTRRDGDWRNRHCVDGDVDRKRRHLLCDADRRGAGCPDLY